MNLTIHVDGGARGNPGPAGAGVVIADSDTGKAVHEAGYYLGQTTNNVAEYSGLIKALERATELGGKRVRIVSDSQLMVKQVLGEYKVKADHLKPLVARVQQLLRGFEKAELTHTLREGNKNADRLANLAMDAKADVIGSAAVASAASSAPANAPATIPAFTAALAGSPRKCLAGLGGGSEYHFGPRTPEGFCVHAAAAALSDGPLQWPANRLNGTTRCRACGATVELRRLPTP